MLDDIDTFKYFSIYSLIFSTSVHITYTNLKLFSCPELGLHKDSALDYFGKSASATGAHRSFVFD